LLNHSGASVLGTKLARPIRVAVGFTSDLHTTFVGINYQ